LMVNLLLIHINIIAIPNIQSPIVIWLFEHIYFAGLIEIDGFIL